MRKHAPSIRHRGYLYAQGRLKVSVCERPEDFTSHRMVIAEDWRAGYLAAVRDAARRAKT